MGSFLVVVSRPEEDAARKALFQRGLDAFQQSKGQTPGSTTHSDWASAATFPRRNGSGASLVSDPSTGSWLITQGTWFHADGSRSGQESRLLDRYLASGAEDVARGLEGFFTLVIGDNRSREIVVLTDLVGSAHSYVRTWAHGTVLSSSSLVLAALAPTSLDAVGCQEFLRTGTIFEDRTFHCEVRKLAPSTVHRIPVAGPRSQLRYWSMGELEPDRFRGRQAVQVLGERLVHAAERVGEAFPRILCDLTGGYDSRAVVSGFIRSGVPFETVVMGPPEMKDVQVAGALARLAGLRHTHFPRVEPTTWEEASEAFTLTDGEYDVIEYGRILRNHRAMRHGRDVSVNGSFGEVARGHWWEVLVPRVGARRPLDASRVAKLRFAVTSTSCLAFPPEETLDLVSHFASVIERTNEGLKSFPNTFQMDHVYLMLRMQRWQGTIASSTDQIWPCLSPFLFRSVLETCLQIPARERKGSAFARRLLLHLHSGFAHAPLEHGYPPLAVSLKTIHRFWPLPLYYGKRVLARVRRVPPLPIAGSVSRSMSALPEVRELLDPARMRVAALTGEDSLTQFLGRGERDGAYEVTWARLLSLEMALRAAGVSVTTRPEPVV